MTVVVTVTIKKKVLRKSVNQAHRAVAGVVMGKTCNVVVVVMAEGDDSQNKVQIMKSYVTT